MSPGWRQARRILCVRLDSLGDVLMCTPAMRALRESLPGSTLTLLTSPSGAALAPFVPEIDHVMVHEAPWMKGGAGPRAAADLALVAALAARAFDAAVIFTTYTQSALPAALLCHLAGIPLRLAHCRENPYHLLSDWVDDPEPARRVRPEVQRQRDLVACIDCRSLDAGLSFALRSADMDAARTQLARTGIDPCRPWLLLHPGASAASRRYPPGHWAQVLRLLAAQPALPLVLTGDASEAALVDAIRQAAGVVTNTATAAGAEAGISELDGVPVVSLAGRLALGELGAALRLATVAVTNNTGPAHMAAAVGTPVVDLYALTNPQHTPWKVRSRVLFHDVPCRFCFKSSCPQGHHACLAGVEPERVANAVLELLQSPESSAAQPDALAGAES